MNVVMIIPTGLGCAIGGHSGDATPAARLLGECCERLILHPNVVNASDINEMPENAWYVEGSILDRFLEGHIRLDKPRSNRILVVVNAPVKAETINAVSAARVTLGIDVSIAELAEPLEMRGFFATSGKAIGDVIGVRPLVEQLEPYSYDALAIHTPIDVPRETALRYFAEGGVNPWGGVEALASKRIAQRISKPVAHAPLENMDSEDIEMLMGEVVDPRQAPELISNCYLHCVLKGLHRAPRITESYHGLGCDEIDALVSPYPCWGPPHRACAERGIPIIMVRENRPAADLRVVTSGEKIIVENYFEAAGVLMAMRAGVALESVRRPLRKTTVFRKESVNELNSSAKELAHTDRE